MENFIFELGMAILGSCLVAIVAVAIKQPIIVAYIIAGFLMGPACLKIVSDVHFIDIVSHVGVALLLFLAGLHLQPSKLMGLFKGMSIVALINSVSSFIIAFVFAFLIGLTLRDCVFVGIALMFSSTILTIKLLPTTTLHQQRLGAMCIGVLIIEDLIAMAALAFLNTFGSGDSLIMEILTVSAKFVLFVALVALIERYIVRRLFLYTEKMEEMLFIIGLAWCLSLASLSEHLGLFYETGAFFAGVMIARHRIALYIAESLKPVRDFFLVLFFFALGAKINLSVVKDIWYYCIILAAMFILVKPILFKYSFILIGENPQVSTELGWRLGHLSEFTLLIAVLLLDQNLTSERTSQFIQLTTIITFVVSSYIVVYRYPTPIGVSDSLNRH